MENPSQIDLRQSDNYAQYMESNGWEVQKIRNDDGSEKVSLFIKHIGPIALAKMQRPHVLPNVDELKNVIKNKRIFMFKFEPSIEIGNIQIDLFCKSMSLKRDNSPLLATKTSVVKLSPTKEQILASFKKDARYTLRKLFQQKIKITYGDVEGFYDLWKKSAKRKKLWIPAKNEYLRLVKVFGDKCILTTVDGLSGACVLVIGKKAFYYYAGSTGEGVKKDIPYLVVWESMIMAKKMGCEIWDFEGIFDDRWPNRGWRGFSHFKNSFSGDQIEYPGAYSLWRLPI